MRALFPKTISNKKVGISSGKNNWVTLGRFIAEIYFLHFSQFILSDTGIWNTASLVQKCNEKENATEVVIRFRRNFLREFRVTRNVFTKWKKNCWKRDFKLFYLTKKLTSGNSEIALLVWAPRNWERTKSNRKCRMATIDVISLQDL